MSTVLTPTFNWRSFALNLARAVRDGDEDAVHDLSKDAFLFENIPCPTYHIGSFWDCGSCKGTGKCPSCSEDGRRN